MNGRSRFAVPEILERVIARIWERIIPRAELLRRVKGTNILLTMLTERIDKQLMEATGPSLKMVANYAVGVDNIDLKEAAKRGIVVTNATHPNVSESVAEHTIASFVPKQNDGCLSE